MKNLETLRIVSIDHEHLISPLHESYPMESNCGGVMTDVRLSCRPSGEISIFIIGLLIKNMAEMFCGSRQ